MTTQITMTNQITDLVYIAYHDHCHDGYTAAWITHNALMGATGTIILVPMEYNEPSYLKLRSLLISGVRAAEVFFVDFSLSMEQVTELAKYVDDITIIDHHQTNIDRFVRPAAQTEAALYEFTVGDNIGVYLSNAHSGAYLCWQYFYKRTSLGSEYPCPRLVSYVEDYDMWWFKQGDDTRYVNMYLKNCTFSIKTWDIIDRKLQDHLGHTVVVERGKYLHSTFMKEVEKYAADPVDFLLSGKEGTKYLVKLCTAPYTHVSLVGESINKATGHVAAIINIDYERNIAKVSMRANLDVGVDVGAIAESNGGGGHMYASGFEVDLNRTGHMLTYYMLATRTIPTKGVK